MIRCNRNKQKQAKAWILSVDPKYFDKPVKAKKEEKQEQEEYQEDEISNYDDNKVTPNYEEFAFAPSAHGSGFIIGDGKYVITNSAQFNPETTKLVKRENSITYTSNSRKFITLSYSDAGTKQTEKLYGAYPVTDSIHLFGGLDKTHSFCYDSNFV